MKNIKDITISIFAIIGFIALVSGFTNKTETQESQNINYGTPESHVWEFHLKESAAAYFSINKVTGEVINYEIVNSREERRAMKDPNKRTYLYGYSSFEKK